MLNKLGSLFFISIFGISMLSLQGCTSALLYNYAKPQVITEHAHVKSIDSAFQTADGDIEVCFVRALQSDQKIHSVLLKQSMLESSEKRAVSVELPWSQIKNDCRRDGEPVAVVNTKKQFCDTAINGEFPDLGEVHQITVLGPGRYQDSIGNIIYP